jgi:DNA-binding Lrp family transcriptional regulator
LSRSDTLDRYDLNILRLLQRDADIPNNELARQVNLSPSACLRRVEKLKASGHVRRTVALLDPSKIELTTLVIVGVVLDRSTPDSFAAFEEAARSVHGCIECHLVAGEFDYFLMIRTKDLERFNRLHGEAILRLPGVRQTRTFFVMREILSTTELPL